MDFKFCTIGISHWNSPLGIREKFSINREQSQLLIENCKSQGIDSLFTISTCNRTQVFAHNANTHQLKNLFVKFTGNHKLDFDKYGFVLEGDEAVQQLFEVSTGLDSQILGDLQIFYQIKEGVKQAKKLNTINGTLDRLLQFVFQANKEVQSFTSISKGAASVAHASVLHIRKEIDQSKQKNILLFGAGEIGERTLENLTGLPNSSITVINRTLEKAKLIAQKNNVSFCDVSQLNEQILNHNVIIVATGSQTPTITNKNIQNIASKKLFIDLSVPRNIDSEITTNSLVKLIDMDMLNTEADKTLDLRKKDIPKAKTINNLYKLEFEDWLKLHRLGPIIKQLEASFEKDKDIEINKYKNQYSSEELEKVKPLINSIVKKISSKNINYLRKRYRYNDDILEIIKDIYNLN
ncbi:MAG: glutamyl-tRNA reductase [Flavobacteriales bacterium]